MLFKLPLLLVLLLLLLLLLLQCSSCLTCNDILEKVFRQHLQEYFLTLACVCRCARKFDLSANALWHWSHWKGFSPVCVLIWPCKSQGRLNDFPHSLHWQGSVCVRTCILRAPIVVYFLSQYSQLPIEFLGLELVRIGGDIGVVGFEFSWQVRVDLMLKSNGCNCSSTSKLFVLLLRMWCCCCWCWCCCWRPICWSCSSCLAAIVCSSSCCCCCSAALVGDICCCCCCCWLYSETSIDRSILSGFVCVCVCVAYVTCGREDFANW